MFIKQYLIAVVTIVSLLSTPYTYVLERQTEQVPTPIEVEQYIRQTARELRIDEYTFVRVAKLESSFNVLAFNPKDTDGKTAAGVFQFKEGTFDMFKHKYGLDYFDINNWQNQVRLAGLMFKDNLEARHWGTFVQAVKYNP